MTEEEKRRSTRRSEEEIPPWATAQGRTQGVGTGWGRGLGEGTGLLLYIKCTIAGGAGGREGQGFQTG